MTHEQDTWGGGRGSVSATKQRSTRQRVSRLNRGWNGILKLREVWQEHTRATRTHRILSGRSGSTSRLRRRTMTHSASSA